MKHKLLLILLTVISVTAFGQTGLWQDGGNGWQFRLIGTAPNQHKEYRALQKSPNVPFAVSDTINSLEALVNKKDFLSTGLIDHTALSATVGQTTFSISAGHGVVANFDNHFHPSIKRVNITAKTGITPQFLTTAITSYVAIDSNDAVVQSASPFTDVQSRDLIIIGAIIHSNMTNITAVNNIAKPIISNTNQLHDLYEAIGALSTDGNKYTANGANLNINKSAGNLFKLGVNFVNDWKSPSKLPIGVQTALTLRYRTQNSTEFADRTTIDPGFIDVAGTRTAISGSLNQFTIQHITLFQSGLTRIQYGQHAYANKSEAIAALSTESFVTEQNIAENGIFRAYLVVRGNATTLNDLSQAEFIEVGKFGSPIGNAGGSVTSANIISALGYTPENVANKAINLTAPDNTKYPSTLAVSNGLGLKEDYSEIVGWGDSLTEGTGSGPDSTYLNALSRLVGINTYNGGVAGETSTQIKNRMISATAKHKFPTIIWAGRNNYLDTVTVKADIATMIASLPHQNYLIMSIVNSPWEPNDGNANYAAIININNYLKATYPNNYFDVREFLVAQFDSTVPQDVVDHAADVPPSSLRSDIVHYNSVGYLNVARGILNSITTLIKDRESKDKSLFRVTGNAVSITSNGFGIEMNNVDGRSYIGAYSRNTNTPIGISLAYQGGQTRINEDGGFVNVGAKTAIGFTPNYNATEMLEVNGKAIVESTPTNPKDVVRLTDLSDYMPKSGGAFTGAVTSSSSISANTLRTSLSSKNWDIATDGNDLYITETGVNNWLKIDKTTGNSTFLGNLTSASYSGGATLTGTPTAPTATAGTDTDQIATTSFVKDALSTNTSGTYTPTLSNSTNVTSSTVNIFYYTRVGNIVNVSGTVSVTPAGSGNTAFKLTLPISSAFTGNLDATGIVQSSSSADGNGLVRATTASGSGVEVNINYTTTDNCAINFTYEVK